MYKEAEEKEEGDPFLGLAAAAAFVLVASSRLRRRRRRLKTRALSLRSLSLPKPQPNPHQNSNTMSTTHDDDQGDDRLTAQEEEQEEEEEAGEEEDRVGGGGEVTSQQPPAQAAPAPPPPRAPPKTPQPAIPTIKPYHPRYRFLHPYYWLNPLALAALYASFRRQWLERAEASVAAAASSDHLPQIPYSRNLTKPSDLLGWERQVVFFFAVVFLYKTLLKRRSWDAAASHYIFYARMLVAVVLFSCDWRWLILHVLLCWFGYAAVAQPTLDLDGLASTRMKAYEKKQQQEEEEARRREVAAGDKQQQKGASAPTRPSPPLGLSLPMHPPRLTEMVLGQGGGGDADDDTTTTTTTTGSAKKAARQLQQQQKLIDKQAKAGWVDSSSTNMSPAGADYWVLLVACLSGGHHAASAAYAPAHDDLAVKYGEMVLKRQREQEQEDQTSTQRPARLRFAHLDAALFGAYCASSPVLGLPPPQQLTWSSAVPCALLIDGRRGKLLARMPTKAQVDAPFTPNMFTSYDVERAFDLEGIVAGRAPKLSPAAAAVGGEEEEDGSSGKKGKGGGGGGGGKSKDA